jgi:hypothetical protein
MNSAQKIESFATPKFRRHSDRMLAVTRAIQRVESMHANRQRRLSLLLIGATTLLIINGVVIITLG